MNMPYSMRKLYNQDKYKVFNKITKRIYSKSTTKEKAERQLKLLRGLEYTPEFSRKVRSKPSKTQKLRLNS